MQARLEVLEREAEERAAELEAAEEEKYLLSSDLEVLQEELFATLAVVRCLCRCLGASLWLVGVV